MTLTEMFNIRPIQDSDVPFLWEMLYQAIHTPAGKEPPPRDILNKPEIAGYVSDWGRKGDRGFIALNHAGQPIGAVWIRLFGEANQAYGYVDDDNPAVSLYNRHGFVEVGKRGTSLVMKTSGGQSVKISRSKKGIILAVVLTVLVAVVSYFTAAVMIARANTPGIIGRALHSREMTLALGDLSKRQIDILLKVEDPNFYEHKGVDLRTPGAGITTITQALVKEYYFKEFHPGLAKFRQSLIARFALDPLVSKDDQLRLFINRAYLGYVDGKPVYGFANAAGVYFGKPFQRLTEDEYLALVAMVMAPDSFNAKKHPDANADRVSRIKLLISGKYTPKSLMDLYYGGKYAPRGFFKRLIWGY